MSASAAIADSLLRRAFGGQARRSLPRRTIQVRLGVSQLRMPISQRDCAISQRTVMNNVGLSISRAVQAAPPLVQHVRVNHGGPDISMPKSFLHRSRPRKDFRPLFRSLMKGHLPHEMACRARRNTSSAGISLALPSGRSLSLRAASVTHKHRFSSSEGASKLNMRAVSSSKCNG